MRKRAICLSRVSNGQYLTVEEAAKALGVQKGVLRNYLWCGRLATYKFKTLTLVNSKEVQQLKEK